MEHPVLISSAIRDAFSTATADQSILALPLSLTNNTFQALPTISSPDHQASFQTQLHALEALLSPRTALYILLRRSNAFVAITYIPYLAPQSQRDFLLEHRHELVRQLGEEHFSHSLICKEIGEIVDARSWEERDGREKDMVFEGGGVRDLGYQKNKCRLCDRRMKNKITAEALEALRGLEEPGTAVQSTLDPTTLSLILLSTLHILPTSLPTHLPLDHPSFTLYHHPTFHLIYLITHSPDIAPVKQRMTHTMAIPGLIMHCEDQGVCVDQKIEIHEPADLKFEEGDGRIGRFRSLFLRGGWRGTEGVWEGMDEGS